MFDSKWVHKRVLVTVLRESLLKQAGNGAFEPRKLKREKVKEVLLSFRRNLQYTARSECRISSLSTLNMFSYSVMGPKPTIDSIQ